MRLRILLPVLAALCSLPLAAQDAPASTPVFHTGAQAVVVDVVVTNGASEPIPALAQKDFQILEDGKPQAIDFFEEHTLSSAPAGLAPQLPPHVFTNRPSASVATAVNVLLLDSLNTPGPDQALVRRQTLDFLQHLQPGVRVAVFALNSRLRLLQGFTADTSLLQSVLAAKNQASVPGTTSVSRSSEDDLSDREEIANFASMLADADGGSLLTTNIAAHSLNEFSNYQLVQRTKITLEALKQLSRYLAGVPGRKNLLWFASSFPVAISPAGQDKQILLPGGQLWKQVREASSLLTMARVAVYPIAAQGIQADHSLDAESAASEGSDPALTGPAEAAARASNTAAMEQLAADTGGRAFYTSNNLSQQVRQAVDNGAHYYTLVYAPANTRMDGAFRRIEVKLITGHYKLAFRRGYYAADSSSQAATPAPAAESLASLLARGLPPSTQVVYQVRIGAAVPQPGPGAPAAGGNSKLAPPLTRYKVDFAIPAEGVTLDPAADGSRVGKIQVAVVAFDRGGKALNWTGSTLGLNLPAASYAQVQRSGIPAHLLLDLPPTAVSLATGVSDLTAAKSGSLEIPVPAPAP